MKRGAIIAVIVMVLGVLFWIMREKRPDPPVPTDPPVVVTPRVPIIDRGTVDVTTPDGDVERVPIEDPDDVGATVTVPTSDTSSVVITVEKPPRVWLPGFKLKMPTPKIRVIGDNPGVIVTEQRLPLFSTKVRYYGGLSLTQDGVAPHVGISPLRVWFVNLGAHVAYNPHVKQPISVAPSAHVEIVQGLNLGIDIKGWVSLSLFL